MGEVVPLLQKAAEPFADGHQDLVKKEEPRKEPTGEVSLSRSDSMSPFKKLNLGFALFGLDRNGSRID